MFEEIEGVLIAAFILVALALFMPCMETIVKALRRPKKTDPEIASESYDKSAA